MVEIGLGSLWRACSSWRVVDGPQFAQGRGVGYECCGRVDFLNPTIRQLYSGAPTRAPSGMQPMEMVHHRINERSSSAREGYRHEAKLQCPQKARATQHHHATKAKAACLDSGDVRLGLSRRSPSERANRCATCRQRTDGLNTNECTVGRTSGNRGARGWGGFLVRDCPSKSDFSRGESQNFLSFPF